MSEIKDRLDVAVAMGGLHAKLDSTLEMLGGKPSQTLASAYGAMAQFLPRRMMDEIMQRESDFVRTELALRSYFELFSPTRKFEVAERLMLYWGGVCERLHKEGAG